MSETKVGCERPDDTLNIHAAADSCEICQPAPPTALVEPPMQRLRGSLPSEESDEAFDAALANLREYQPPTDQPTASDIESSTLVEPREPELNLAEIKSRMEEGFYGRDDIRSLVAEVDRLRAVLGPQGNPPCMLCGGPHPYDTSLPSVRWNAVIRANHYPDYMCLTCIVKAFALANESFTAQLFGGFLNGMPIEVRVNGQAAIDTIPLNEENNQLRCKVRELESAVADQAQASPAVVERAPLEQLIADWKENSTRASSNAHNPKIATLDRRQCEGVYQAYEQCADELEALLLAWPSSREREKSCGANGTEPDVGVNLGQRPESRDLERGTEPMTRVKATVKKLQQLARAMSREAFPRLPGAAARDGHD